MINRLILRSGAAALLALTLAVPAAQANRLDVLTEGMISYEGTLNETALRDVWDQRLRPEAAAQRLLYLMNFQTVPSPFYPELSVLQYQLGLAAANARQGWTPEFAAVCNTMQRYLALFETLAKFPLDAMAPVSLVALPSGKIPETDCLPIKRETDFPQWTAASGTTFTAAVAALPRRPLREVKITAGALTDGSGNPVLPANSMTLTALQYRYEKNSWSHIPAPAENAPLDDGFRVYLLRIALPAGFTPGVYSGTVNMQVPNSDRTVQLYYQLTVTAPQS